MEAVAVNKEFILETLRANRDRLSNEFGIERIGLYGSFSRNEETETSDIDLVYQLTLGKQLSREHREHLYRVLRRKLHRKLDLVDSQHMNPFIAYKMEKDVIYV